MWDAVNEGIREHKNLMCAARSSGRTMADLLRGNLRVFGIEPSALADLKRELAGFDMRSGTWKK